MTPPAFFDPRMRGFRDRTPLDDAIALVDRRTSALGAEAVALPALPGRVLAADVVAAVAVPGFDRAAMDGYALRGADTTGAGALALVGESMPGRPFAGEVGAGQAVRIMTGAPVPRGADAVVPVERAEERGGTLLVREPVAPGRHVGRRGEDVAPGGVVLRAGRRLRPQDVGLLASVGVGVASVVRRPRVDVFITGEELLPAGSVPAGWSIVDSNSPMLAALVARDGGEARIPPILKDDRAAIRRALLESTADVLLVSGGTSVGKEDHAPSLVAELGELAVHGIAMRPAGPSGIGWVGGRPVFLLPGNPVSCLVAYDLLAGRAVRRLGGRSGEVPYSRVEVPLSAAVSSAVGRVDYVRVRMRDGAAEPLPGGGASRLSTATAADGFVLVPREIEGYPAGARVVVRLYDPP